MLGTLTDGRVISFVIKGPSLEAFQVHHVGTVESKLIKFERSTDSVLVCCDRPALFYIEDQEGLQERLELQFLCEDPILTATAIKVPIQDQEPIPMLAYRSSLGKLVLGNLEPNARLQSRRIGFRKQVNRVVAVAEPGSGSLQETELLVASLEEPNFGYLDSSKDNVNIVALISKSTFRTIDVFKLDKNEVVNCLLHVQK